MAHHEEIYEVDPGRTILSQGEEDCGFFILEKGTLEVIKDGILLAVLMYPGTIFGEMGDILGKARTCSIRSKTKAQIRHVVFDGGMEELTEHYPDIAAKIIKTLASRLERTTQKLVDTTRESPVWSAR